MSNQQIDRRQAKTILKAVSAKNLRKSGGILKCLVDGNSHKLAQRMYFDYVSDQDFSKFPLFLQKLDRMLYKFGGKTAKKRHIRDDDDVNSSKKGKKGKGNKRNRPSDDE
jgi:hypothetical protein